MSRCGMVAVRFETAKKKPQWLVVAPCGFSCLESGNFVHIYMPCLNMSCPKSVVGVYKLW